MDSCNTAHDLLKVALSLNAKATGGNGPQAHTREGARAGGGREDAGGDPLDERAGSFPQSKSKQAELGRPAIYMDELIFRAKNLLY
jgi:hypothetical protein